MNPFAIEDILVEESVVLELKECAKRAKVALNTPECEAYRKKMVEVREQLIQSLVGYTNTAMQNDTIDITSYGVKVMRIVTRIQDMNLLLSEIEKDLRKEPRNG